VSTIANSDSIDISRIMGIARIIRAAGIEPFVKSRFVPTNASRNTAKTELSTVSADGVAFDIDIQTKFRPEKLGTTCAGTARFGTQQRRTETNASVRID
jgi:hypothetical protein